jgi:hypothetical protein
VIVAAAAAVGLTIFGCVSNQQPSGQVPKTGRPLVTSLPADVKGVELAAGAVRVKPGFQWVKQPDGSVIVARMAGGVGIGGTWKCACTGSRGKCTADIDEDTLTCVNDQCTKSCKLTITTKVGGMAGGREKAIMAF